MPNISQQQPREPFRAYLSRRDLLSLGAKGFALALFSIFTREGNAAGLLSTTLRPQAVKETLDLKIAQMLMVGFHGSELTAANPVVRDVRDRGVGGLFIHDYATPTGARYSNVRSPAQLAALTGALQALAPLPLLISTDQEGGQVARLKTKYGFPATVSQQYLGNLNKLAITRHYAQGTAKALANAGVNLNLAPVVDLNSNPSNPVIGKLWRSFSANPVTVTKHALEVIEAHRKQGVLCTLKHFPGHGSSRADSHLGFVDVTHTWSQNELQPYEQIIKAGKCDLVMTAHIFNANLDPTLPATLSKKTITGILRDKLGYTGVVISDDMSMKAIAAHYSLERALLLTITAGVDIISITPTRVYQTDQVSRATAIIKRLVQNGTISSERIDQSYARIKRLKQGLRISD